MTTFFRGVVVQGPQRGTALGFPTINITLNDTTVSGVYAARVSLNRKIYAAAAFADQKRNLLEAYILDFSGNVYGKRVSVKLEKKIREAQFFDNDAALRAAIASDVTVVREYFNKKA